MSGSYCYGLKARFYGLFFQLPWSFFVTICVLLPVLYAGEQQTRVLLIELTICWTIFIACVWIAKDIFAQRFLFEFKINDGELYVYNKGKLISIYDIDQIEKITKIAKDSTVSRFTLGGSGLMIKFDDGREFPVLDQITGYKKFNNILQKTAVMA